MVEVRTKRELITSIAERWKTQYYLWQKGEWWKEDGADVYRQLTALPAGTTEADVSAIIGNTAWTLNLCSHCGADVDVTVRLGNVSYEPEQVYVCRACLTGALEAANRVVAIDKGFYAIPD